MRPFTLLAGTLAALAALVAPLTARADVEDRLYDFTDAYYLQNGVNPAAIAGRRQAGDGRAVLDRPIFRFQRNVRVTWTQPAYDHSGDIEFFSTMGGLSAAGFTNNAAGRRARQIADTYVEYVFPRQGANPVGLGVDRQAALLDMRNGYFSNNPLGLWIHVWVVYTDRAFNTAEGQQELSDLARRNGLALDGTPIIRTVGDIDRLFGKGLVSKLTRPLTDVLRYAICPVNEDPTDGGIAPDAFLTDVLRPDGTPVEPEFRNNFLSLKTTGDWAD